VSARTVRRALVTGCAGFIGSHLTEALLADGVEVVGVDCFNANYGRPQKLANLRHARAWDAFDFVPLDLATGELEDLVAGVDTVFHLAAEPGVRASWGDRFQRYMTNNVLATQQLLRAVQATGAPGTRLVYASSSSVYGDAESLPTDEGAVPAPVSPYGLTKLSGEHLCAAYAANFGLECAALRYFTVFGPRQRPDMAFHIFADAILAGRPVVVYGAGDQTRDFTYVGDVVAATRAAATQPLGPAAVFNVGGGLRASVADALALLGELTGRAPVVEHAPAQPGDVRDTGADTTRARAQLGWAPAVDLREGLEAQVEWMRERAG
jgi:nucleoside-diphosphate-sugar epimerase